jgi:hypothetical protein
MKIQGLGSLVNNQQSWNTLTDLFNDRLETARANLDRATDLPEIYRYQGRIADLKELLNLRTKVNGANNQEKGVS